VKNYTKLDRTSPGNVSNDTAQCYREIFRNCAREALVSEKVDFLKIFINYPISLKLRWVV